MDDARCRATCACGFRTGWRRNRHAALRAVGDHVDQKSTPMSPERAVALASDYAIGLHDEYQTADGCGWIDCARATVYLAEAKEEARWREWRERAARQDLTAEFSVNNAPTSMFAGPEG